MKPKKPAPDGESGKKPYRKPELVVHGNIRELTKANKGGHANDGSGKPSTNAPTGSGA